MNIQNLDDLIKFLEEVRGNTTELLAEGIVAFMIGTRPVTLVLEETKLTISVEVGKFDSTADSNEVLTQALTYLQQNAVILPYAYALVQEEDNSSASVVLLDSIPVGDLSEEELNSSLDSLRTALTNHDRLFS